MLEILAITGPIYIAIALGYAFTRNRVFSKPDLRMFGRFVIKLALPCLLFNAVAKRDIGDIFNPSYLLVYLMGTLAVIGLGLLWGQRTGQDATDNVVAVMGMSCPNSSYIGYPILLLTVAPVAGVALALNMLLENVLIIPLLLGLAERSRGEAGHWTVVVSDTLKRLVTNPLIVAVLTGLVFSLMRWSLPEPVARSINLFAMSSAGLSLFVIGGTLVDLPLNGMGRRVAPIVIAKLGLHPLAVFLATLVLPWLGLSPLEPSLKLAAVIFASVPMMGIYPLLAQSYGKEDLGAAALLVATVVSFFSLSGLIWLVR